MSAAAAWGFPVRRLKYVVNPARPITYGIVQCGPDYPGGVPYIRPVDMTEEGGVEVSSLLRTEPEIAASYSRSTVLPEDLVISIGPSFGKVMKVPAELAGANLTQGTARIAVARTADARFVFWALRSTNSFQQWESSVGGATFRALNLGPLGETWIPMPDQQRQRVIADYLDRETVRLDALVAAKERVLGLLAEKRRALITRAVTRGLDPRARLRDTGISWLGEIPAHWGTRRVAWLFRERDERGEPDLPLLEVSISSGVVLREFSDERIESTAADFNSYKVARQGDVVFNKMRMWQGAVGIAPQDGLVSPDYVVAAPTGKLSPQYAGLLFRTGTFSAECARRSHGIVWDRLRLYWEGFREIELPLPSLDAQNDIVTHLAEETAKLDALRSSTERSISLLKERRAALIVAAVTGKIAVEGAAWSA
jgi:type I restriction enzyme, S subunit